MLINTTPISFAMSQFFDVVLDDEYEDKISFESRLLWSLHLPNGMAREIDNFFLRIDFNMSLASDFLRESDYYRNYDFIKATGGQYESTIPELEKATYLELQQGVRWQLTDRSCSLAAVYSWAKVEAFR